MDHPYPHQPPPYGGGYMEPPHAGRPPPGRDAEYTELSAAASWTSSRGYHSSSVGFAFPPPSPGPGGYGDPAHMGPQYAFDPSVPPPPFGCPPPAPHFPYGAPGAPINQYFAPAPQSSQPPAEHHEYLGSGFPRCVDGEWSVGARATPPPPPPPPVDEAALQRKQDEQWLRGFLPDRVGPPPDREPRRKASVSVGEFKDRLLSATRLLSELRATCRGLELRLEDERAWEDSYPRALDARARLQEELSRLTDAASVGEVKSKLRVIAKRKARRRRSRMQLELEERRREEGIAERDAAIGEWRMKQIRRVEEKKKEQELKQAADSVLCEVRKKQADMKRMQDILRSLEKLRKLRKEAASRKGIVTDQESDEAFSGQLEKLRSVMRTRTVIYSAEEKALMVMLEGEQEEERRRDLERQLKKERERQLQRRRKVDAMLFGDDLPDHPMMQPFRDFYTQAQRSLHALVQIRRGWDVFLVPADHPDGTPVPQSWVLPDAPSDPAWASALQSAESECDGL